MSQFVIEGPIVSTAWVAKEVKAVLHFLRDGRVDMARRELESLLRTMYHIDHFFSAPQDDTEGSSEGSGGV